VKKLLAFASRISVRVFAFNFLIAFLPIAGMLSLGTYERQLLRSLEHALVQQGRVLAAALAGSGQLLSRNAERVIEALQQRQEARIRVVDATGKLLADSSRVSSSASQDAMTEAERSSGLESVTREPESGSQAAEQPRSAQETFLYRLASFPVRIYRKYVRPPQPPLESADFYSGARSLSGPEILAALEGRYGAATRVSAAGQRSVTLYSAVPVLDGERVSGVVLVSQSTYRILSDLYDLRLDIFTLFLVSVATAAGFSLLVSATITVPLRRLRDQAGLILDRSGRLRGRLPPTHRRDEIGDLSRRFADLTASLERQLRMAESFASDLSHELKNPLASIRSAAELLSGARDREDLVGLILDDVSRMERLLTDVRELSRLDAGAPGERTASSDPKALAEGMVEAGRRRGAFGSVRVSVTGNSAHVAVPPELLLRVLENLLDNAVSFSLEGGEVVIGVCGNEENVAIAVLDQGPGIPEENREKVFGRFFTSRPHGDSGRRHAGLGLAIVKAIAESYGGAVRAADGPSGGARVEVLLPRAAAGSPVARVGAERGLTREAGDRTAP
jgi:two-component system sensor histidine kinase ChvG